MPDELPFSIEPMMVADVPHVLAIEAASFTAPWSARAFLYEINQNTASTMLVVRPSAAWESRWLGALTRLRRSKKDSILGYGGFWLLVDEIHISTIAVYPQWRTQGIGEFLLLALLDRGIDRGAQRATLEVRLSNLAAQALYVKCGFALISRRRRYYSDNNEDAYIMATPSLHSPPFQANLRQRRQELLLKLQAQVESSHLPG
ncbi:ribosomal protein S18-alanine N-acetyltransferase [Chloroflexota bacterium]